MQFPQSGAEAWAFLRERYRDDPAFADRLETVFGGKLLTAEWLDPSEHDEIRAGWFIWALREAVSLAGHYRMARKRPATTGASPTKSTPPAKRKKLACLPGRNTLTPPWNPAYWTPLWQADGDRLALPCYRSMAATVYAVPSVGDQRQLEAAAQFTASGYLLPNMTSTAGPGNPVRRLAFDVVDRSGRSWVSAAKTGLPSEDVDKYFRDKGVVASEAKQARFKIETWCVLDCNLRILAGNTQIAQIPLTGEPTTINRKRFQYEHRLVSDRTWHFSAKRSETG